MKQGYLSKYFKSVAVKKLSAVEVDPVTSNQHEFNGVSALCKILGTPADKEKCKAKFLYLTDYVEQHMLEDGFLTWYDARRNHPTRTEYRLYFPSNSVMHCAAIGDLLVIAQLPDGDLLTIIAKGGTTIEQQVRWLFGFSELSDMSFSVKIDMETEHDRISYAARVILESIGIEVEEEAPSFLEHMLNKFGDNFPTSKDFSIYARSTLKDVNSIDNPDTALLTWMEREEILFRTFEKHIFGNKIIELSKIGSEPEPFLKLAMSIFQRRKSRAGSALENHREHFFIENGITYTRTPTTEGKSRPDFILPSIELYKDTTFSANKLTMLGAKTTCKDRWRQILSEASRISPKHLITLEPSISENQTAEMQMTAVQLILPSPLHTTYTPKQQSWLMNLESFRKLILARQS